MSNRKLNNEAPAEEIKDEATRLFKEKVTNQLKQAVTNKIFTTDEVKIERLNEKLTKKEFKIDNKFDDLGIEKKTFQQPLKNDNITSLEKPVDNKNFNQPLTGGESLKKNTIQNRIDNINTGDKYVDDWTKKRINKDFENLQENFNLSNDRVELLKNTDLNSFNTSQDKKEMITKVSDTKKLKPGEGIDKPKSLKTGNKKLDKLNSKELKLESKIEVNQSKEMLLNSKRKELLVNLEDKKKTPFSSAVRGERTLGAKVITSPMKTSSYLAGTYKKRMFDKDIQEFDDPGLKFANRSLSVGARQLKKQSVNLINNNIGFDRKANNLLKLEKNELNLKKKTLSNKSSQVKINRKRQRIKIRENRASIGSRLENAKIALSSFIKSLGNAGNIMKELLNSKLAFAGGGALIMFVVMGAMVMPIGIGLAGGLGGVGDTAIVYEYGDVALSIDLESKHYHSVNPYTNAGYRGQCTWYVWGRVHELYNKRLPAGMGNGQDWADSVQDDDRFTVGTEPRTHSIMVLGGNEYGHVAFVESYDPDTGVMIVSEGNIGNPKSGTDEMVKYARDNYADYFKLSNDFKATSTSRYGMDILGYIYLEDFVDMEGN